MYASLEKNYRILVSSVFYIAIYSRIILFCWFNFCSIINNVIDSCAGVCVCVCVCVCVSVHRKDSSWLNRTMDVTPDIQTSDVVLKKLLRIKNLRLHLIDNHSRDLLDSNCARVSIKPGKAARSKRTLKTFWKQR